MEERKKRGNKEGREEYIKKTGIEEDVRGGGGPIEEEEKGKDKEGKNRRGERQ